jgi:hypothetical protein
LIRKLIGKQVAPAFGYGWQIGRQGLVIHLFVGGVDLGWFAIGQQIRLDARVFR